MNSPLGADSDDGLFDMDHGLLRMTVVCVHCNLCVHQSSITLYHPMVADNQHNIGNQLSVVVASWRLSVCPLL